MKEAILNDPLVQHFRLKTLENSPHALEPFVGTTILLDPFFDVLLRVVRYHVFHQGTKT